MAGRWQALLLGLAGLGAAALTYLLAVRTTGGQSLDAWLGGIAQGGMPATGREALQQLARPLILYLLGPLAVVLALLSLARGRWRPVLAVLPLPLTIVASHRLQQVLERPDLGVDGYGFNTFPSTHATAGFVAVIAVGLLWPTPLRSGTITGLALCGALVAIGNIAYHDHRHADVAGSFLLVAGPALLAFAAAWPPAGKPRRAPIP